MGKSWQQEHETAGHATPAIRKPKEMNVGVHPGLFFYSVPDSSPWNSDSHVQGVSSHLHLTQSSNSFTDMPRSSFFLDDSRSYQLGKQYTPSQLCGTTPGLRSLAFP